MTSKENVFNNIDNNVIISSGSSTKFVAVKFLTSETVYFGVEKKCKVNELFSKVCVHLGLSDCAELFGLAVRQFNCPTSIFGSSANSNYYSASQVEESIRQDDSQFEEEYIFLNPNEKISKYTSKNWKNSKNGLDPLGKAYLQCFFRVQFYIDSYLFLTDRIARHHYYLQLKQNIINYNLANLTLERAFLLASLALQAERGNYNDNRKNNYQQKPTSSSILNSTFINNENYNLFNQQDKCYFDPYEYMPRWIIDQMGENYIIENMPTMHKENENISKIDSEIMFIKEASEICPHNLHMYRLYKTNPSTFSKKLSNVNNHFNALFHGHHFNSSINSNSSIITNHSSIISNNNSNLSNHSIISNNNKESKIWLGICATGVQIYDMDCINKSSNDFDPSINSDLQLKEKYQDQLNNVCYLRSKLSTFNWSDIEKLFFDKKKFEIRSNGYPSRRFTYYAATDEMAKNLLWLCKFSHRFQLFIQPKLKEMKKRENEFARRKYRESYIYSEEDNKLNQTNNYPIKLKTENWIEYQNEPMNKYLYFNNNIKQDDQNSSLSTSRNTLINEVDRESLNASQNYHLSPLSRDMGPIMEKFDRQISKLQFNHDLEDSSSSSSNNQNSTNKSIDQVDYLESLKNFNNQINTNPFLDKTNYDQLNYQLFNQSQQHQIENLDEFVIEHKDDKLNEIKDKISNNHSNAYLNKLTVQPLIKEIANNNELNENNEEMNNQNLIIRLNEEELMNNKSNKQTTFSLESLTCSALSEPSSSDAGISEQEFSTSSCASGNGHLNEHKNNNSLCNQINYNHLIHPNTESPNSEQSRCSSNTSYSSDSALSKCSKQQTKSITQKLVLDNNDSNKNFTSQSNCIQKLKHYAFSVNDLHNQFDIKNDYKAIDNLKKDYQLNLENMNANNFNQNYHNNQQIPPKPKTRKSKFEMKNKNKSNIMYKSLPNVNNFNGVGNQFGKLDLIKDENLLEKERFIFFNRSDKSTSSEQSVSTIKSNDKTNSSTKLTETNNDNNDNRLNELIEKTNLKFNKSNQQNNWYQLDNFKMNDKKINETNLDSIKIGHTYANLPFQKQVINNNLLNCSRNSSTNSFLPAPNLTPNRIATKIGISSLNRCNNKINSAQKNQNLKLNLLNNSLDRPNLRTTCSYQLLNYENLSTINNSNQLYSPFKTTRTSSDPGVLTYSSTNNLSKIPIEDSINFYRNLKSKFANSLNEEFQSSSQIQSFNFNRINNSLNNINDLNVITNNLAYDQPLINQINNQRKNVSNRKNQNYPLRLVESEMNLISNTSDHCSSDLFNNYIPPPSEYSDNLDKLNKHQISNSAFKNQLSYCKLKATSEQKLNTLESNKMINKLNRKLNLNDTESIDSIEKLKQKTHELDLPLISQLLLFNDRDRSLILPKTVATTSRQKHQKPKRYSLENTTTASDLKLSSSLNKDNNFKQTNLDDSIIINKTYETNLDSSLIMKNQLKYDNNYNNLESNNLNKLSSNSPLNNRSKIVDELFEHLLN